MNLAAIPLNAGRTDAETTSRENPVGSTDVENTSVEVPIQLGRSDEPGTVPAIGRLLSPQRLELRCTRLALTFLTGTAGPGFFTPETLSGLRARLYLPQRVSTEPVLTACVLDEVAVSSSGEFVLRASLADVSAADRDALDRFCGRYIGDREAASPV